MSLIKIIASVRLLADKNVKGIGSRKSGYFIFLCFVPSYLTYFLVTTLTYKFTNLILVHSVQMNSNRISLIHAKLKLLSVHTFIDPFMNQTLQFGHSHAH